MSVFKCKICGGEVLPEEGAQIGVCAYCGTRQTLPRLDDERRLNLYERANHLRRENEYDRAAALYEQLLVEDPADAEGYWSLLLCRYGVEYVQDPKTHRRLPTVHRTQYTSILDDENYKSALQYADEPRRQLYEQEAKAINEIQKGILALSQKEEPFDVFICYKETDAAGRRTPDSVLATELYQELTEAGFRVFCARMTLEKKLGEAYEPYIFAALHSSKVMVVLGTRPDYFNAVWVKNEWSRYLALIEAGEDKTLIPAYRDMDPYDLPDAFAHLQAQDMDKLGFMQDLIHGIRKLLADGSSQKPPQSLPLAGVGVTVDSLLQRAFLFLEDGDWQSADEYCEKVLDAQPTNARAYLGKLLAEKQCARPETLLEKRIPIAGSSNYEKILRYGDESLSQEIRTLSEKINDRCIEARMEAIYTSAIETMQTAQQKMQTAQTEPFAKAVVRFAEAEELYGKAAGALAPLINYRHNPDQSYRDAPVQQERCLALGQECHKQVLYCRGQNALSAYTPDTCRIAIDAFSKIPGWRDADALLLESRNQLQLIQQQQQALQQALLYERKKKRRRILIIISIFIAIYVLFGVLPSFINAVFGQEEPNLSIFAISRFFHVWQLIQ